MSRKSLKIVMASLIAAAAALVAAGGAMAEEPNPPHELRNYRYCEVIPFTLGPGTVTAHVYNTLGWNECPAGDWNALTEQQVNLEFGSFASTLNGPRYWVIDHLDGFGETAVGEAFTFGGIKMSLRAKLETPIGEPVIGEQFYVPNEVQRETRYTFHRDEPTFQLIDPEGHVYVMQSYAQIVDPNLNYGKLKSLGSKLALPAGWTYRSRTYDHPTTVTANGLAYVVNDDLSGSYQRMTPPAAKFSKVTRSCRDDRFRVSVSVAGDTARTKVKFGKKVILKRTISRNFTVRIPTRATRPGSRQVTVTAVNDAGNSRIQTKLPICRR